MGGLNRYLGAALIFAAVALVVVAIAAAIEFLRDLQRRKTVKEQLETVVREGFDTAVGGKGSSVLEREPGATSAILERMTGRFPRLGDVGRRMRQAEISWSVETFFLIVIGMGVAFGLVTLVFVRGWIAPILAAAFGAYLPWLYVKRKRAKRLGKFEEQLPDSIDLMGRAIRAGHPLSAGLKMVGDEMPQPTSGEFRRVFEEQRFGLPFEDALLALVDRVELVDTRILVTAILIQREVGGNLAEILDKLAQTIRARFTFNRQLRVFTAQGRITGYVLALLPIVVGSIILMMNPEYMMTLFTDQLGKAMLISAGIMQIIGFLWIRRIVDIEF